MMVMICFKVYSGPDTDRPDQAWFSRMLPTHEKLGDLITDGPTKKWSTFRNGLAEEILKTLSGTHIAKAG